MSSALLDRLRVKQPSTKQEVVGIVIKPPEKMAAVSITPKIIDRRDEPGFDRKTFLAEISTKMPIVIKTAAEPQILKPESEATKTMKKKVAIEQDEPKMSEPEPEPEPEPAEPEPEPEPAEPEPEPAEPEPATAKKPKPKPKKKLEIVSDVAPRGLGPAAEPEPELKIRAKKKISPIGAVRVIQEGLIQIGDTGMAERVAPKKPQVLIKSSAYYMDNREIFINFINSLFAPYKEELKEASKTASCESRKGDNFDLMAHQKIVRDYINLYTPYRGILLYHGLGSGKTCSSIAIAEGMKDSRKIIVMTPASLKRNYYEELKKCGDSMYKKNQFWEFVAATSENIKTLSAVLSLEVEYIKAQGGAWLVNSKKKSNYETIDADDKKSLDKQLDEMIERKYRFLSYNGLRKSHMKALTTEGGVKHNPFDNAVVIIDEAHNIVSRIVNKLTRKPTDSVSIEIYELLMSADNVRIILLSGTPIINYPNEIAILFNMLRGYIKTWHLKLTINSDRKVTKQLFEDIFKSTTLGGNVADFIDYKSSTSTLTITRNPFGFVNQRTKDTYGGVHLADRGNMTDAEFISNITRLLLKEKISISSTRVDMYKALPDGLDDFKKMFINSENNVQNMDLLKRRILGLTSYFRSAQENLMPRFTKSSNFYIVDVPMSDFQFGIYEEARVKERKLESDSRKKRKKGAAADIFEDSTSTYRIFSRAFCNFVFPKPDIVRPMPADTSFEADADEDILDTGAKLDNIDGKHEADELVDGERVTDADYDGRIRDALLKLSEKKAQYLTGDALDIYSPKFKNILDNIKNPEHVGLHLVYSQFRTLEGIGIFKIVLEANGYTEFVINNTPRGWRLAIPPKERGKPMFVLYTGTESSEQKEIVRNVFNGDWKYIPSTLAADIRAISPNNLYGELIKVFMITASGAEGISLKNTRYVHLMEPYWHPVRIQQVIGRARRICSHQDLPAELRTVDVFLYLMKFSRKQLDVDATIELKTKDVSKLDSRIQFTSDQALWEIAIMKEAVTEKLLDAVKESAIDCSIHSNVGSEKLNCFSFGPTGPNKFSFSGSFEEENTDAVARQNMQTITIDLDEVTIQGIKYAYDKKTGHVYDFDSYMLGRSVQIGKLVKTKEGVEFQRI